MKLSLFVISEKSADNIIALLANNKFTISCTEANEKLFFYSEKAPSFMFLEIKKDKVNTLTEMRDKIEALLKKNNVYFYGGAIDYLPFWGNMPLPIKEEKIKVDSGQPYR